MNDQDEVLGYDADHDDPKQYCEHGTFIGSWWGPDYLCGFCEMGISQRSRLRQGVMSSRHMLQRSAKSVAEQITVLIRHSASNQWLGVSDDAIEYAVKLGRAHEDRRADHKALVKDVWRATR